MFAPGEPFLPALSGKKRSALTVRNRHKQQENIGIEPRIAASVAKWPLLPGRSASVVTRWASARGREIPPEEKQFDDLEERLMKNEGERITLNAGLVEEIGNVIREIYKSITP